MSRDLRKYSGQTNFRLVMGGLLLILLIGIGLIYLFYGLRAALMGLACMLSGLTMLLMIWLCLWLVEKIVNRANQG